MLNFTRFSVLTIAIVCIASTASAVDLASHALVDIVEGIVLTETAGMDFGTLSKNDGTVVIAPDGSYTDAASLMFDPTGVAAGGFTVQSVAGADVTVSVVAGAMPAGLDLNTFTLDVAGGTTTGTSPQSHTMAADTDVLLVGASLDVTGATATVGDDTSLPFTVTVVFQ